MNIYKSILFAFVLCLSTTEIFSQTPPPTPSNPNPVSPIPTPVPPLPPATNPSAKPVDPTTNGVTPAPNQPAPVPITPAPQTFPKSQEDTVFKSIEPKPEMKVDSVNKRKYQ